MSKPRGLFITVDVPLDDSSGGQIASWRCLECYCAFAEMDVLALVPWGSQIHADLEAIARRVSLHPIGGYYFAHARGVAFRRLIASQLGGQPYRLRKFASSRAGGTVREWTTDTSYSFIHCDHLSTFQYARFCSDTRVILMDHDVEWQLLAALARQRDGVSGALLRREARRTRAAELSAVRTADHTLVLSDQDRRTLVDGVQNGEIGRRIGVWPVPIRQHPPRASGTTGQLRVLVLGSLRSLPRADGLRWFLQGIWPHVRANIPVACLTIVGADPPADILDADGKNGIRVYGYVENIEAAMANTDVCAIPLTVGSGLRIKVLELLSRGIPCVGTPIALRGMEHYSGIVSARTAHQWTQALADCAKRPDAWRAAAENGREAVQVMHSTQRAEAVLRVASDIWSDFEAEVSADG